ncbi:MAG: alpha/beta hydrolase [Aestuariibacter sp.]
MNAIAITVSSGTVHQISPFPSQYFSNKTVHVWLPAHYSASKEFAVLYMHDGQHLFDASLTWNNQEWGVDEVASRLMQEGKVKDFIVVAVFNGNVAGHNDRHREYFPEKVFTALPEARRQQLNQVVRDGNAVFDGPVRSDDYLRFLVQELKPYIDKTFSVATDAQNTFIMGSSMGGLISMYAISEYPEVFSAAACLSTHWLGVGPEDKDWLPPYFFQYMVASLPDPKTHRIYFDFGTETLDQYYPPLQAEADKVMRNKGYSEGNWLTKSFPGAAHDENSWKARLHEPLEFLLSVSH